MKLFKKKKQGRQPQLMAGQNDYVFRRSRTLTGSVSPDVKVSAPHRGQLKTDRLKLHELKAHRRKLLHMLGGVILVIVGLVFLIANFIATPTFVAVRAGKSPNKEAYQKTVYDYFADHPLERFGFLLNPDGIEAQIKRNHSEISSVSMDRDWYGGNVRMSLYFRQPLLVWRIGAKQFYVDGKGIAFDFNHFSEPSVAVTDQTGLSPDTSGAVASTRFIRFLGQLVGNVNNYKKGRVVAVIIPRSTREIDIKLEGRDYPIKTDSDRDAGQQAEDIANTLAYLDQHALKPQYIDLRVAHKAYLK